MHVISSSCGKIRDPLFFFFWVLLDLQVLQMSSYFVYHRTSGSYWFDLEGGHDMTGSSRQRLSWNNWCLNSAVLDGEDDGDPGTVDDDV